MTKEQLDKAWELSIHGGSDTNVDATRKVKRMSRKEIEQGIVSSLLTRDTHKAWQLLADLGSVIGEQEAVKRYNTLHNQVYWKNAVVVG